MAYTVPAHTVFPKKYAHGFCFAVLCCGYTLTDFPISIRLTSLALWQSNDCPSASKATLMNMDKYFMWIHYERLHNHNKAKHNKTVCIFLGIYCMPLGINIPFDGCEWSLRMFNSIPGALVNDWCGRWFPDSKVHGANMGPPGSCWPQMGPILAPWTLLSGIALMGGHCLDCGRILGRYICNHNEAEFRMHEIRRQS